MENKSVTAVDFLINTLRNYDSEMLELFSKEIKEAKEMEKQQIIAAWNDGLFGSLDNAGQYYNETFKN